MAQVVLDEAEVVSLVGQRKKRGREHFSAGQPSCCRMQGRIAYPGTCKPPALAGGS